MIVQTRPRVSFGFASTMSSPLMFTFKLQTKNPFHTVLLISTL